MEGDVSEHDNEVANVLSINETKKSMSESIDEEDSFRVKDQGIDQENTDIACAVCKKKFSSKPNMYKHQRNVHNVTPTLTGNCRCPEVSCEYSCQILSGLRAHLIEKHGKKFEEMKLSFLTYADFTKWKTEEEKQTRSRFVSNTGIKRQINGKEKKYFTCHRSGVFVPRGQGKKKMKLQGTCRIGSTCTASMEMEKNDEGVHVIYNRTHMGHSNAVGYLTLTDEERIAIAGKLLQGASFEKILEDIKDAEHCIDDKGGAAVNYVTGSATDSRMLMLKRKDLHNISREFNLVNQDKEPVDISGVRAWVEHWSMLGDLSPVIYVKYQGEAPNQPPSTTDDASVDHSAIGAYIKEDEFLMVLMTATQRTLFEPAINTVCIDSIHGVADRDVKLVTVLVIDEFGAGVPLAFCITTGRVDFDMLTTFFGAVRRRVGAPVIARTFVSDDSPTFHSAWVHAMGAAGTDPLLCTWDVDRIWRQRCDKIGGGRDKQALVYKALRALLRECSRVTFEDLLEPFCSELLNDPDTKSFGEYFKSQYAVKPQVWAQCYRVESDVDSNMCLEATHHTLEACYLQGKKYRQVDRLLDLLLKLVRDKSSERLLRLCKSRQHPARKLSSMLLRHRTGTIVSRSDIREVQAGRLWLVVCGNSSMPATDQDEHYLVEYVNALCPAAAAPSCKLRCKHCKICIHMYLCSCRDFLMDANICRHVHAVATVERAARGKEDVVFKSECGGSEPTDARKSDLGESLKERSVPIKRKLRQPSRTSLKVKGGHSLRVRRRLPKRFIDADHRDGSSDDVSRISSTHDPIIGTAGPSQVAKHMSASSKRSLSNVDSAGGGGGKKFGRRSGKVLSRTKSRSDAGLTRSKKIGSTQATSTITKSVAVGSQERQLSAKLQMILKNATSKKLDKSVMRQVNQSLDSLLKIINENDDVDVDNIRRFRNRP